MSDENRCSIFVLMLERHIIWFRNDLRVHDNAALSAALASGGEVIPLYIFDPADWARPERSRVQFDMLSDALADLQAALAQRGATLYIRTGNPATILADLHRQCGIAAIHMHNETSDTFALMRDRRIAQWCLQAGISLRIQDQHGVRVQGSRDDAVDLQTFLRGPRKTVGDTITCAQLTHEPPPEAEDFGLGPSVATGRAGGGRSAALELLRAFIGGAGRDYPGEPADQVTSRLSPHLSLGTVSIREVWQRSRGAAAALRQDGDARFATALDAFAARIEQRSHLLQRAEDETRLSGRAFDHDAQTQPAPLLDALMAARTGFPVIDASIRLARRSGWLPYQHRTLLAVFAVRTLWLDPAQIAPALGSLMGDFSPALNALNLEHALGRWPRLNLVLASRKLDPEGRMIADEVPELALLPPNARHAPWDAPKSQLRAAGLILGQAYPMPIVDHVAATRGASGYAERPASAGRVSLNANPRRMRRKTAATKPLASVQLSFDLPMPAAIN